MARQFKPDKTDRKALSSEATILLLYGTVGVGKSSLALMKIVQFAATKMMAIGGIRRCRVLVARTDMPKLETSTLAVLKEWFGDGVAFHGVYPKVATVPVDNYDGTRSLIEFVIKGFPDSPSEIYDNFSGVPANVLWVNEVQTYSTPDMIEVGFQRMGRYLSRDEGNIGNRLVIGDFNPPSSAHWLADWRSNPPDKVAAELKIDNIDEHLTSEVVPFSVEFIRWPSPFIPKIDDQGALTGYTVNPDADYFYKQPSGIAYWAGILAANSKSPNKIRTNILGEFGYRSDGIPVYDGVYNDRTHVSDRPLSIDLGSIVYVGCDPSGFRGAAVFMQETTKGWVVLGEVAEPEDQLSFYELLHDRIVPWLRRHNVRDENVQFVLDPANHRNDAKMTPKDECTAAGFQAVNAPTNDPTARIEALRYFLVRNRLVIDNTEGTKYLRQGLAADYYWKKRGANMSGERERPEKTRPYSDVVESAQYVLLWFRRGASKQEAVEAGFIEASSDAMTVDIGVI